jgi:hypothetical protein
VTTNHDVLKALASFRRHLRKGGVLVMDFWYGPAVLTIRPEPRKITIDSGDLALTRRATPILNSRDHTCTIHYELEARQHGTVIDQLEENHVMRYFFPREIEEFLDRASFSLESLSAFPDLNHEPTESDWEAMIIAVAR